MNNQVVSLSGEWNLESKSERYKVKALIPGDTHCALLHAGAIKDPFWGTNELDVLHLNREDWIYSRNFEVTSKFLEADSVFLNFDAIDTISEIRINGKLAGESKNAFLRSRFEVKSLLNQGENRIEVEIFSAEVTAEKASERLPFPIPYSLSPIYSAHRNLIRKVQSHSGWDWAPCLMISGIYGATYLQAVGLVRIEHVYTTQTHLPDGLVEVEIAIEYKAERVEQAELKIVLGEEVLTEQLQLSHGESCVARKLVIANPQLWWPNGHGDPFLYQLEVSLDGDKVSKRIGLRQLEIINEEDEDGLSFVIRVNGRDIFSKGANWIPVDALLQRASAEVYRDLLESAKQVHMNTIRVWGGGLYESDIFYELCDELGLMVWQDCMFACALYPADENFLKSVDCEVRYQVKRLRDHPSIVLWCGNNENLGALTWYQESQKNRDRYLVDYDRLNEGIVGKAVRECDSTRTFWPSSPCGGPGDYSDCWHDDSRGDMHFWSVWHERKSFDAYFSVKPRFCSEFGFQSFPSLNVIRTFAPEEEFNATAPMMEHHQRNPMGNQAITEMLTRYFRMPEGFSNFVYLTQLQQGLAIKTAVEHWRRLQPVCMGTLYWQLNDNWPVCSWSSINYGGKWKLLHYMAKRFYAPTFAYTYQSGDDLEVWVVRDFPVAEVVHLACVILDFSGKPIVSESRKVELKGVESVCAWKIKLSEQINVPEANFLQLTLNCREGEFRNEHFFCLPKRCRLELPEIKCEVIRWEVEKALVELSTTKPAFFVSLEVDGVDGQFNDNAITLLPGEQRRLEFSFKGSIPTQEFFKKSLQIYDLRSSYL